MNQPGSFLHWSIFYVSVANLVLIAVMVVIFGAALLLPFPRGRRQVPAAVAGEAPDAAMGNSVAPASGPADEGAAGMWTCGCRKSCHAVDLVFFPGPGRGKFGIWLRGSRALRHIDCSCHCDSLTSRGCGCPAGLPCSPGPAEVDRTRVVLPDGRVPHRPSASSPADLNARGLSLKLPAHDTGSRLDQLASGGREFGRAFPSR
jgi:hypothetical protein